MGPLRRGPDERKARPAAWPKADFIVGNPPWVRIHRIPAATRALLRSRFAVFNQPGWMRGAALAHAGAGFAANTFGAILGCITGREPEPLPLRHYTLDSGEQRVERVDDAVLERGGDE